MIFHRDLEANQRVCPHCGHHMRVGPDYRFAALFDEGSWQRIEMPQQPGRPAALPRPEALCRPAARRRRPRPRPVDALEAALGRIGGLPAVIAVMNFEFMGGSMGISLGEGFVAAARHAVAAATRPSSSSPPRAARGCRRARCR